MSKLSLQWRITLMTVLLIGLTCVAMKWLLCTSGIHYMDAIGESLQGNPTGGKPAFFDPDTAELGQNVTIVIHQAQKGFCITNWYITAGVMVLSGILAYFVSERALKPLHRFTAQVEKVQLSNLADMKIETDVLPEFQQLSHSFNQMLERLNNAFVAQKQFTGNAAHELRTPLALMQAQLELFAAEHPDMLPETATFLCLLQEQTERLTRLTKTLLEMSNLQQVARNEQIQLAPMIEEIFADLVPLAEKSGITLKRDGDGIMIGSDALIYRLLFNLTENAIKYNPRMAWCRFLSRKNSKSSSFAFPTPDGASPMPINGASSSPSSVWTNLVVERMAAQGWGFHWCGRLPIFTVAAFGLKTAPQMAPPSQWKCQHYR